MSPDRRHFDRRVRTAHARPNRVWAGLSLMLLRAVQITRFGGPQVLEIVDVPAPAPGPASSSTTSRRPHMSARRRVEVDPFRMGFPRRSGRATVGVRTSDDDPTHYRFVALQPDALEPGAPLRLGWSDQPPSEQQDIGS